MRQVSTLLRLFTFIIPACLFFTDALAAAPSKGVTEAAPALSIAGKKAWQTRMATRLAKWRIKKMIRRIEPVLFIASRDSNCLTLVLKSGEKLDIQNANITLNELKYQPCGQYKIQEQTLALSKVFRLEAADGQVVFSSRPRNQTAAQLAIKAPLSDVACSKIVLGNGETIIAQNIRVMQNEVVFNLCGQPNGSEVAISQWYIHSIWHHNGVELVQGKQPPGNAQLRMDPYAKLSFIFSLVSLTLSIFGILMLIAAIVLGAISLKRIRENPEQYRGRNLALAGIIISSVLLMSGIAILGLLLVI